MIPLNLRKRFIEEQLPGPTGRSASERNRKLYIKDLIDWLIDWLID